MLHLRPQGNPLTFSLDAHPPRLFLLFLSEEPHLFLHPHPSLKPRVDARVLQCSSPITKLKGSISLIHFIQMQNKMAIALF